MSWEKIITQGIASDGSTFGALLKTGANAAIALPGSTGEEFALALTFADDGSGNDVVGWKTVDLSNVGSGSVTGVTATGSYLSASASSTIPDITLTAGSIDIAAMEISGTAGSGKVLTHDGSTAFAWADDTTGDALPSGNSGELLQSSGGTSWSGATIDTVIGTTLAEIKDVTVSGNDKDTLVMLSTNNSGVLSSGAKTISSTVDNLLDASTQSAARTAIGAGDGTQVSTDVSIGAGESYISLNNQTLTLAQIDLASEVSGSLPKSAVSASSTWATGDIPALASSKITNFDSEVNTLALAQAEAVTKTTSDSFIINEGDSGADLQVKISSGTDRAIITEHDDTALKLEVGDLHLSGGGAITADLLNVVADQYIALNDGITGAGLDNNGTYSQGQTQNDGNSFGVKVFRGHDNGTTNLETVYKSPGLTYVDQSNNLTGVAGEGVGVGGYWAANLIYSDDVTQDSQETVYTAPMALKLMGANMGGIAAPDEASVAYTNLLNGSTVGTMFVGAGGGLYIKT